MSQPHALPTPPASAASPAPSTASLSSRAPSLPTPRSHRLQPGSQKETALINYLDNQILKITGKYAKRFVEGPTNDKTPGYTTYDQFVADVGPLVDVAWISGTPSLQIPYLLQLAGFASSYLQAFPFSRSVFPLLGKIDQGFATLLQSAHSPPTTTPQVTTTEKVRIRSLIEQTRVEAVNAASSGGYGARLQDITDSETDDDDDENETELDDEDDEEAMSIPLAVSRIYKRTLEILGDSLVNNVPPQPQEDDTPMM